MSKCLRCFLIGQTYLASLEIVAVNSHSSERTRIRNISTTCLHKKRGSLNRPVGGSFAERATTSKSRAGFCRLSAELPVGTIAASAGP